MAGIGSRVPPRAPRKETRDSARGEAVRHTNAEAVKREEALAVERLRISVTENENTQQDVSDANHAAILLNHTTALQNLGTRATDLEDDVTVLKAQMEGVIAANQNQNTILINNINRIVALEKTVSGHTATLGSHGQILVNHGQRILALEEWKARPSGFAAAATPVQGGHTHG